MTIEDDNWFFSGCAVRGRSHVKSGKPCQDKVGMIFKNGIYVVCLSDGAGSAAYSEYGAECVVNVCMTIMVSSFDNYFADDNADAVKESLVTSIKDALNKKAEELQCGVAELASTMLLVAIRGDEYIIGHVGDGAIGYLVDNQLKVASVPVNGEHVNETYFVTSDGCGKKMRIYKGHINRIEGFFLMSDGTEQTLYNRRRKEFASPIKRLLQRNVILKKSIMNEQLEDSFKRMVVTKTTDDCSIAILSRRYYSLYSFDDMPHNEKCALYGMKSNAKESKKRIERFDKIIYLTRKPVSCSYISRKIHLKYLYTKRHLSYLRDIGLIQDNNGYFSNNIQDLNR